MSADHRLILGDCLGPEGLTTLPDRSVDHVIADPPYEAEAHTLQRRSKRNGGVLTVEPLDFDPVTTETRERFAVEAARLTRRWVVVFCQAEAVQAWREALVAAGAVYKRAAIWVKPDGMPQLTGDRPAMGYESIICAHAKGQSRWNGGGRIGVYEFLRNSLNGSPHYHPTMKPLDLMEALVRDFTDPGDLVCDPFAGSCTTGVAAKRLGRRFVGWEKSEAYWKIGTKRLDAALEQFNLFRERSPKPRQSALDLAEGE